MQRRHFLLAAACLVVPGLGLAAEQYRRGLLWRIEKKGVAASYLFGTLHLPDARLLPLPQPVAKVFARCRRLVVEMLPNRGVGQRFADAMTDDAGPGLDHLLGDPHFAVLRSQLSPEAISDQELRRLKPWAALLRVTAKPGGASEVHSLDTELFLRARFANRPVEELEAVDEQIAVFDDIPLETQLALLRAAIDFRGQLVESAEELVAAYLARDLVRLQRAGRILERARPELQRDQRILEKKLIEDRSVVMAYRMQSYLRRGSSFFAIGAAHLVGDTGIPALLVGEYGWRVRPHW